MGFMEQKTTNWVKIAESAADFSWQPNQMCIIRAGDKTITIAKHNDQLYAFAHKCPHASGIMADGTIDALGNIVCPLHRYRFSMQNGRNSSGEGYYLKTYPVKTDDSGVYIGLNSTGFFNF